ncbi:hypothetical protein TSOC_004164 [Tetrabaena socialis]|uniref:Uncharacterized protein n=1 Tax=Tetrabaena socialis TaxID=47790 RepID=A0A2J8A9N2_9CHLO|nr:hypothetical protein TSOC_004164 [Tetrabaena socialis]|eukprot:PNH09232.1 hypothetical protein TSOC_004164 [Tetrabaena socialis]
MRSVGKKAAAHGVPALRAAAVKEFLEFHGRCWFARQARAADVALMLLEVVVMNVAHTARKLHAQVCGLSAAGALPALGAAEEPLFEAFPCSSGYARQLLYTLSSGAALNPFLTNLAHLVSQLLAVAVALASPSLYERCRHGLFVAVSVATVIGVHASAAWTADGLLPDSGAALFGSARRQMGAVYIGWKTATVLRVPASLQLLLGPLLWLLLATGAAAHTWLLQTAVAFVMVAVLPYILARASERTWLRPLYRSYLRATRGDGVGAANGGSSHGAASGAAASSRAACTAGKPLQPAAAAAAPVALVLRCLRCVVAASGGRPRQQEVHLDAEVDTVVGCGPDGGGADGGGYVAVRLSLPPAALREAGALVLHLLPPTSRKVVQPQQQAPSQLQPPEASKASAAAAAPSPPGPLATVPLLVLPADAAEEVVRLYGEALGRTTHVAMEQLLSGVAGAAAPEVLAERAAAAARLRAVAAAAGLADLRICRGSARLDAAEVAAAAASIHASGLAGLSYGIGSLLQLPYEYPKAGAEARSGEPGSVRRSGRAGEPRGPEEEAGGGGGDVAAWVVASADLLRFFASRRLAACLREGLRALRAAGVRLSFQGEEMVAVAAAGGGGNAAILHRSLPAAAAGSGTGATVGDAAGELVAEATSEVLAGSRRAAGGGGDLLPLAGNLVASPAAFAWPPALALQPTEAAGAGGGGGSARATAEQAAAGGGGSVVVVLPAAAAALQALRCLRCVVTGPAGRPRQQEVHLDAEVDTVVGCGPDGAGAGGGGYVAVRPCKPVLSPSKGASNTSGAVTAAPSSIPLATATLLVLPAEAAAEVVRLYGEALGRTTQVDLECLLGGMTAAAAALVERAATAARLKAAAAVAAGMAPESAAAAAGQKAAAAPAPGLSGSQMSRGSARLDAAAVAAAAASIQASGLAGLSYDMGSLLQLPYEYPKAGAGAAGDGCEAAQWEPEEEAGGGGMAVCVAASAELLRFFASRRLTACLREGLRALRAAGVRLSFDGEGLGGEGRQEQAYQAFKAGQCRFMDSLLLVLTAAFRASSSMKTWRGVAAEYGSRSTHHGGSGGGICHGGSGGSSLGGSSLPAACSTDGAGAGPVGFAAAVVLWASGRGRLTHLQLQMVVQLFVLAVSLTPLALSFTKVMQSRRRNTRVLFRGLMDMAGFAIVLWPAPWPGPLLPMPDAWTEVNSRYGIHWFMHSFWEPGMAQLSPRLQLWLTLAGLLPMALVGFNVYDHRWRPGLIFCATNAAFRMIVSAATDLPTRRAFLRRQQRGGLDMAALLAADGRGGEEGGKKGPKKQH